MEGKSCIIIMNASSPVPPILPITMGRNFRKRAHGFLVTPHFSKYEKTQELQYNLDSHFLKMN